MGIIYREWRTTASALLADLQTHMLAAGSDWTRPNAGARPHTYKCVTTRGAEMVIDFNDAAPDTRRMQVGIYKSYDGTVLGSRRPGAFLFWKASNNGTAAANPIYVTLSHSKEHFFLMIEGPRFNENAAESQYGSPREYMFMDSLFPYYDNTLDPSPTVISYAKEFGDYGINTTIDSTRVRCRQSVDGTVDWTNGTIKSIANMDPGDLPNRYGLDGKLILMPWVFFDDRDGYRGRLTSFFNAGPNYISDAWLNVPVPAGTLVDQGGIRYKILEVNKGTGTNSGRNWGGAFGTHGNNGFSMPNIKYSTLVAVPYSATP